MNRCFFTFLLLLFPLFLKGQTISEEIWDVVGCVSGSGYVSERNDLLIDSIVNFALSKVGTTYQYGASGPDRFDCSGFVRYTFQKFGISLLRSSKLQYTMGKPVNKEDIKKGDLVFFKRGNGIGHVGLVIEIDTPGNYRFVHASTYKAGVRIDHSSKDGYARTYVGARRIIENAEPTPIIRDSLFGEAKPVGFTFSPNVNMAFLICVGFPEPMQTRTSLQKGYLLSFFPELVMRRKELMILCLKK